MRAFKAGCLGAIPPALPRRLWQVLGTTAGIFFNCYRNKYFYPSWILFMAQAVAGREASVGKSGEL